MTQARGQSTVLGWLLPHLMTLVAAQGHDAERIRRLPGLRGRNLEDPDLRIPELVAEQAWQVAAAMTGDSALGLHLAEALPRGALDLVEYAFRSSASLAQGLERLARYGRILSDRLAARVERRDTDLLMLLGAVGSTPLHPARTDFSLAVTLRLARDATGRPIVPLAVTFPHPPPDDVRPHERFFRCPVHFSSGIGSCTLTSQDAALPLQGADQALAAIVRRRLDKALAERSWPASGTLAEQVRRMIIDDLGQGTRPPEALARTLDLSPRTLARRLAREQTSYRRLLDEVRRDLAMTLLQDPTLSVADIAFFLQYSEPAAFHRSFRRWTGRTPRAFRREA